MGVYSVTYYDEKLKKLREDYNAILEAVTPQVEEGNFIKNWLVEEY